LLEELSFAENHPFLHIAGRSEFRVTPAHPQIPSAWTLDWIGWCFMAMLTKEGTGKAMAGGPSVEGDLGHQSKRPRAVCSGPLAKVRRPEEPP
jgi:hypothetical protein